MKRRFLIFSIFITLTLTACHDFNNEVDPAASDYIGFYVYEPGTANLTPLSITADSCSNNDIEELLPLIEWEEFENISHYQFQLSSENNFSETIPQPIVLTSSSYQVEEDELQYDTTYYWRIRIVTESSKVSAWSDIKTFRVKSKVEIFGFAPIDDELIKDTTPLLEWASEDYPGYRIRYSTVEADLYTASTYDETDTDYQMTTALQFGDTVYWQTCPLDSYGNEISWSDVHHFSIDSTWLNLTPSNVDLIDTTPTLNWDAIPGAAGYHIQISDNEDFSSGILIEDDTIGGAANSYTVSFSDILNNGTDYFWRIKAKNSEDTWFSWSEIHTFSIEIEPPLLSAPSNGESIATLTPTMEWNTVTDALQYRLQINTNSGFTGTMITDETLAGTSYTLASALSNGTVYYWRVLTVNQDSVEGEWCSYRSFSTDL